MTDQDVIATLRARPNGPTAIVAITLFGEARGTGPAERAGIASVIANRVKAQRPGWGLTADAVCLAKWQFSCWTPIGGVANYETVMDAVRMLLRQEPVIGPALTVCLAIAAEVVSGALPDSVQGSTHYLTRSLYAVHPPAWAHGLAPTCQIGSTLFFAGVA